MKVLIVGLGSIGRKHVQVLRDIDASIDIWALRSGREQPTIDGITDVYDISGFGQGSFDFIIISSPTAFHLRDIIRVKKLSKVFFIEKPLSGSLDIVEYVPVITGEGIRSYIACNLRFLDSLIYVKEKYISNSYRINEINVYCGSYLPEWRPDQNFRQSYSVDPEKGGGVHLDLIHEIDYIYWFFGIPEKVSKIIRNVSSLNIAAVDYANFQLAYKEFTANITLNYYRRDAKRTLEIVTDQCTVNVNLLTQEVYENNLLVYKSNQSVKDTYKAQLQWFIQEVVVSGNSGFNDINEATEILKIVLNNA